MARLGDEVLVGLNRRPYLVENIQIHNQTSTTYQLDWVMGNSTDPYWGEFSVYLDLFATRTQVSMRI